ncbi:hypothetical protein BGW38_010750, partial [Lunasporangiospora selenospora]
MSGYTYATPGLASTSTTGSAPTSTPSTSRATQYTVLNASLERLQANLDKLEQN